MIIYLKIGIDRNSNYTIIDKFFPKVLQFCAVFFFGLGRIIFKKNCSLNKISNGWSRPTCCSSLDSSIIQIRGKIFYIISN